MSNNKESIDTTLARIEQKIDYVNRIVDRIEASEKKLMALDYKVDDHADRVESLEMKVGRINFYIIGFIIFILSLALASKLIN